MNDSATIKCLCYAKYLYFLITIYHYFSTGSYITTFFKTAGNTIAMPGSFRAIPSKGFSGRLQHCNETIIL